MNSIGFDAKELRAKYNPEGSLTRQMQERMLEVLQVIDANVFAYMQDFEVSDDISMRIEPSVIPVNYATSFSVPSTPAVGMRIEIKF